MIMVEPFIQKFSGNGLGSFTVNQVSESLPNKPKSRSFVKVDKSKDFNRVFCKFNCSNPDNADTSMEVTVRVLPSIIKKLFTRLGDSAFHVTPTL